MESHDRTREFEAAFERYSDELFRHAFLRLSNRERAVELTQETFLKAWGHLRRGEEIRQYRPFLYRILHNLIIDEYRRHTAVSLDALLEDENTRDGVEGGLLKDDTADLEAAMIRHDAHHALATLKKLPPLYRDTLIMRYIDGLSIQEIADACKESENAVSVRLHRGLRKLRDILEKEH